MQKLTELVQVIALLAVYCFQYALREREREVVNMEETVFTLARLKIFPTISNLYHIQCQSMLMN